MTSVYGIIRGTKIAATMCDHRAANTGKDEFPMPPEYTLKRCSGCKEEYPRTPAFFNRSKNTVDGLAYHCKTCSRAAAKKNYFKYHETKKQKHRDWRANNLEHARAHSLAKYYENRDEEIEKRRSRRKADPEKFRAASRLNYQRHKDEYKITTNARRRARLAGATGMYSQADIERQYAIQRGLCWWNAKHSLSKGYEIDHLVPLSRGGHNSPSNIVLACQHCNRSRGAKLPEEWAGRLL